MLDLDGFIFTTSQQIVFRWGASAQLVEYVKHYGTRVLLLHSRSVKEIGHIKQELGQNGLEVDAHIVAGEPTDINVNTLVAAAHGKKIDVVLGLGGGSVLDTGKAVSALLANPGDVLDYVEVVGKGLALQKTPLPFIAVPTTAGTGTEVTKNAVIKVTDKNVKVSMRDMRMIPRVALIDPSLTLSVPPEVTASTGMDAFVQVLEPYISRYANCMVDMFCRDAIPLAAEYLPKVYHNPTDQESRTKMAWVSLLGGLSLANAKLGAVHGFAGPIGGMFDVSHGVICAALLPQVFRMNSKRIVETDDKELTQRLLEIASWVTGTDGASIAQAVEWFIALNQELNIPRLRDIGIRQSHFEAIIKKSMHSSSMKGNPVLLSPDELREILENS